MRGHSFIFFGTCYRELCSPVLPNTLVLNSVISHGKQGAERSLKKIPERIRVLHVITGLQGGGAEMMLYKLLGRMDRDRFSNVVLSLTAGGEIRSRISELGIPCHDLGIKGLRGGVGGLRGAVKLIREFQ